MKFKNLWLIVQLFNLMGAWYFDRPLTGLFIGLFLILFFYLSWICELLQSNNRGIE